MKAFKIGDRIISETELCLKHCYSPYDAVAAGIAEQVDAVRLSNQQYIETDKVIKNVLINVDSGEPLEKALLEELKNLDILTTTDSVLYIYEKAKQAIKDGGLFTYYSGDMPPTLKFKDRAQAEKYLYDKFVRREEVSVAICDTDRKKVAEMRIDSTAHIYTYTI